MPWKNMDSGKDFTDASGLSVTPNFADLYGIRMVEGRFFSKEDVSRGKEVVINKSAIHYYEIGRAHV